MLGKNDTKLSEMTAAKSLTKERVTVDQRLLVCRVEKCATLCEAVLVYCSE